MIWIRAATVFNCGKFLSFALYLVQMIYIDTEENNNNTQHINVTFLILSLLEWLLFTNFVRYNSYYILSFENLKIWKFENFISLLFFFSAPWLLLFLLFNWWCQFIQDVNTNRSIEKDKARERESESERVRKFICMRMKDFYKLWERYT